MLKVMVRQQGVTTCVFRTFSFAEARSYAETGISFSNPNRSVERVEIHDHKGCVDAVFDVGWASGINAHF